MEVSEISAVFVLLVQAVSINKNKAAIIWIFINFSLDIANYPFSKIFVKQDDSAISA